MIFGAILAGGIGSRMQTTDLPKQFLPLGDRPVVIHTLETFLACSRFDCIYVGIHSLWLDHMAGLLEQYSIPDCRTRVRIVAGGAGRNDTIFSIIREIEQTFGESEEHILVTHDAVRPFVTTQIIEENIDGALQYGAVDTVLPAADTIVESTDGKTISHIPNRADMYQGQTPQSFQIQLLKRHYAALSQEEKQQLTDACKICVLQDYPVHLVLGSSQNLKITTAADYAIAQAMVAAMPHIQDFIGNK